MIRLNDMTLEQRLAALERAFDLKWLDTAGSGASDIRSYYRVTRHAYSRYHDPGNAVHMGLSDGPEFQPDDLTAQARFVDGRLQPGDTQVVELATGRGMNAIWLARRHPDRQFLGLDLTPAQLAYAHRDGAEVPNFTAQEGNFHDLSSIADGSVDLVFIVEALCHSDDKPRVATEVARILRPGGQFIVIDGYRGRLAVACSAAENRALHLLARGMAVTSFQAYDDVRHCLQTNGLAVEDEQDRSAQVLPSLKRSARLAERYLNRPFAAWLMRRLLPRQLINTGVSGALFPILLELGVFAYWITVLRKG